MTLHRVRLAGCLACEFDLLLIQYFGSIIGLNIVDCIGVEAKSKSFNYIIGV
jgi:hypothetical protein